MAITYKVRYKNHCTPQEQILTDGRWYLDSDSGRKLTGDAETSATLSATGTLTPGVAISGSAYEVVGAARDFVYIKNTGDTEVTISLTDELSGNFVIALAAGEAFASEIHTSARVYVKSTGTSTIEYFSET
jgi:hypothetical protein